MEQDTFVCKYIDVIDLYKVDVVNDLLTLYKIGADGKKVKIRELQLHNGYQQTLKRYLIDKSSLSSSEVIGILELYTLGDHAFPTGHYQISVITVSKVPAPNVKLHLTFEGLYAIDSVPLPIVRFGEKDWISVVSLPAVNYKKIVAEGVVMMPTPNVRLLIPVPPQGIETVPKVNIKLVEPFIHIDSIPKPVVRFGEDDPSDYLVSSLPKPIINIGLIPAHYGIDMTPLVNIRFGDFYHDVHNIISMPKPIAVNVDQIQIGGVYYYGVHETAGRNEPRPTDANFENLVKAMVNTIPNELEIDFPRLTGYYIFAIPSTAMVKTHWFISNYNSGFIGGSPVPVSDANLWPDPIQQTYQGVTYNVYITSYATIINNPVTLSI